LPFQAISLGGNQIFYLPFDDHILFMHVGHQMAIKLFQLLGDLLFPWRAISILVAIMHI
jgi:hypothetical protein